MPKPLALIFGESPNDTRALRHLVPALLPEGKAPECRPVREPGTLSRGAATPKRRNVAEAMAIVARQEARSRRVAVISHEDCDAHEDAHIGQANTIIAELRRAEWSTRLRRSRPGRWKLGGCCFRKP
jgi:hypothetical protein